MLRPFLILALAAGSLCSWAGESYQPLFVVERSTNANVVHYDARITPDGQIDSHEPVVAYWIMAAKDGRRQELNFLEKSKAYGVVKERSETPRQFRIALVSERQREILVYREGDTSRAETLINGRRAYLQKIYVNTRPGTFYAEPYSIELTGTDIQSGETLHETVPTGR